MSKSLNSPTARLLQSSRLFSLPKPLPQPKPEAANSSGFFRASDTATLPYPTHQAITTPRSSLHRGDWGLKRSLPGKTTRRTSTPHLRILAQDNFAHITDFESAANHTLTEQKWRQMSIPLSTQSSVTGKASGIYAPQSVYDESVDNVELSGNPITMSNKEKWKHQGPWIAGMSEGEFRMFLEKKIEPRKEEFVAFLKQRLLNRRMSEEEQSLRQQGLDPRVSNKQIQVIREEIDAKLSDEVKALRKDQLERNLGSELTNAICEFLDLPSVVTKSSSDQPSFENNTFSQTVNRSVASEASGPPSTHPGAGLSHLRSNAYMENHPIWGPQSHRTPVLARVLQPRSSFQGATALAKLGVGGVVADDVRYGNRNEFNLNLPTGKSPYLDADRMTHQVDVDLEGGNKIWVHPERAYIDAKGSIRMHISRGEREAVASKTGDVEHILEAREGAERYQKQSFASVMRDSRYATNPSGTEQNPRPVVRKYTDPYAGEDSAETSAAKIKNLLNRTGRGQNGR